MKDSLIEFSDAELNPSHEMAVALTWLNIARPGRRIAPNKSLIGGISGTVGGQKVVNNRHFEGSLVGQTQFDANHYSAHKCPFVMHSTVRKQAWIEESSLTESNISEVSSKLVEYGRKFVSLPVSYDPVTRGEAAPNEYHHKCIVIFFPAYKLLPGNGKLLDQLHATHKREFMQMGLTLGQFYASCSQGGVYNQEWRALTSPYPAFAIRYLSKHDILFNPVNSQTHDLYKKWFDIS
jgi:hypothetical protein